MILQTLLSVYFEVQLGFVDNYAISFLFYIFQEGHPSA